MTTNIFSQFKNSLYSKSTDSFFFDDFSEIHKVSIPSSSVEKFPSIAVGQKLCVFGKLRFDRFKKHDGTVGYEFIIRAQQIFNCDIDGKTGPITSIRQTDDVTGEKNVTTLFNSNINEAHIFSHISFEVINKVKFSSFYLASNYFLVLVKNRLLSHFKTY